MPKSRKKKVPVTRSAPCNTSSTPERTRTVIRRFHILLKKQAQLQQRRDVMNPEDAGELRDVEREIEELGGLKAYQQMSSIGQGADRGGGTEKVFIGWLRELGADGRTARHGDSESVRGDSSSSSVTADAKGHADAQRDVLELLEVGALKPDNYSSCSTWIRCTPMDLRSRHPGIVEQDFLLMDEVKHRERWGALSLSLVLNFVPEPKDRGES
jgi:25S rRNA (adenine2142-N1)-methyltransferase